MPWQRKIDYAEVQRLHQEGLTRTAIAARLGVSCYAIYAILKRFEPKAAIMPTAEPLDCFCCDTVVAPCEICGRRLQPVHVPTRGYGWYCAACCPVCNP